MKVLITGAHFTTAVAVIEELKNLSALPYRQAGGRQDKENIEIVYVGRKTTMEGDSSPSAESQILPKMGVKFIPIVAGRLQRSFTLYTVPALLKIPVGFLQSIYIILREKPDVVVSFGGYVGVPVVFVSWLWSIPILIHEQTLVSGLANKISGLFADKVAVSFNMEHSFNKEKVILTGNPIRKEILRHDKNDLDEDFKIFFHAAKKERLPVILVTGGNQGSHIINKTIEKILPQITKRAYLIHQTGDSKFQDFEQLVTLQSSRYLVKKFINQMGVVLSTVDLVIARAGINTLTEACVLGKPVLTIPIPFLYQDEQNKNARFFNELGLVQILSQSKLNGESLLKKIQEMIKNLEKFKSKAKLSKKIIIQDAAKRLALEVLLLHTR